MTPFQKLIFLSTSLCMRNENAFVGFEEEGMYDVTRPLSIYILAYVSHMLWGGPISSGFP